MLRSAADATPERTSCNASHVARAVSTERGMRQKVAVASEAHLPPPLSHLDGDDRIAAASVVGARRAAAMSRLNDSRRLVLAHQLRIPPPRRRPAGRCLDGHRRAAVAQEHAPAAHHAEPALHV